jgi:hypothetical protein
MTPDTPAHRNQTLWQGLISIATVLLALVLYRAANLPLVAAIIIGFTSSTFTAALGYLRWAHGHPGPGR